jgi:hypothetical protein
LELPRLHRTSNVFNEANSLLHFICEEEDDEDAEEFFGGGGQ